MSAQEPIAIVGYSYRAPGVGRKGLWDYLAEAKSAWSKVPEHRFNYDAYHYPDKDKPGCIASAGGHFLPGDPFAFDAPFFNFRAEEARGIDPHHRMLLECSLEAAESAGISLHDLAGSKTGVFSAIGSPEHSGSVGEDTPSSNMYTCTGSAPCMYANRLSYFFNLTGPSIALDAACAGSAYAVHLACQSLYAGDSDAAFVGGSTLLIGPNQWSVLDTMGALSADGRSYSYDVKGSGFGRGEGGASLLLKRLSDATKAGDPIHAVIRNSGCNHSGLSDGITMPSRVAQENLLRQVHDLIGLDPSQTPVVEGHGTGTKVGDPIEAGAFASVMASKRTSSDPLYIGSLKSNFGHLEGASGIIAMVKAILMVKHGKILPNAGFEKLNESIEGKEKLKVLSTVADWPTNAPKRVCVTNFGFGGSNAAIIVEAPGQESVKITNGTGVANGVKTTVASHLNGFAEASDKRLFVLSAKTETSLVAYIKTFQEYLDNAAPNSTTLLNDLCYTLGQRRTHYAYRVAVAADSVASLKENLATAKPVKIRDRTVAFAFTGQGAQYAQMGLSLLKHDVFLTAINRAEAELLKLGASWSLKEELAKPQSESRVNEAEISQPACTALQLGLVLLLRSWGVEPTVVTGHSSGEIAGAFAAGLISFETAVAVAFYRGLTTLQLIHNRGNKPKGAMLALGIGPEEAGKLLEENRHGYATIAAINSRQSVTLSGDEAAICSIEETAKSRDMFVRRLKVNVAYHSLHMEQVAAEYLAAIEPHCSRDSKIPDDQDRSRPLFVSSVTGKAVNKVDASYWIKNLLQTVRFSDAISEAFSDHNEEQRTRLPNVVIEIGPHSALKTPIKQTIDSLRQHQKDQGKTAHAKFAYLASLLRDTDSCEAALSAASSIFTLGIPLHLSSINKTSEVNARVLVDLPAYEWDRSVQYLHRTRFTQAKLYPDSPYHPLLGWKSPYAEGSDITFRQVFTLDEIPWIRDHKVGNSIILPMTGFLALALEAVRRISSKSPSSLLIQEFHNKRSLEIEEDQRVDLTTKLTPAPTGTDRSAPNAWNFEVLTWTLDGGWVTHCYGMVEAEMADVSLSSPTFKTSAPLLRSTDLEERAVDPAYTPLSDEGTHYGSAFKRLTRFWESPGCTVMESELRDFDLEQFSTYGSAITVDPPTLDSFLQGSSPFMRLFGDKTAIMPNYFSRFRISNNIPAVPKLRTKTVTLCKKQDSKSGTLNVSVAVFIEGLDDLSPIVEWESLTFRVITSSTDADNTTSLPMSYFWDMVPSLEYIPDNQTMGQLLKFEPSASDQDESGMFRNHAAVFFMDRALEATRGDDATNAPSYLARFRVWAESVVKREKKNIAHLTIESVRQRLPTFSGPGELLLAVGEELPRILRGEVQPLEIMLQDNLLSRSYEGETGNIQASYVLARWVNMMSDIKAVIRVLEIGAGTGSATVPIFETLSRGGDNLPRFFQYTYTDISAGFFENAHEKLKKWSSHVTYKKLDIGQDPKQQGFSLESYDLIVASNCLHATPNMVVTIDNVRSLLKPGGKLILLEAGDHTPAALPFALLPGWWLSEDKYRNLADGPLLCPSSWNRLLLDRGFSGADNVVGYDGALSVITSTRVGLEETRDAASPSITICGPLVGDAEEEFAQVVSAELEESLDCETWIKPAAEINSQDDRYCVFIDSPTQSYLNGMTAERFSLLKRLFLNSKAVIWVIPENSSPDCALIKGFIRAVRLEHDATNLILLENAPLTSKGAEAISKLSKRLWDPEFASNFDKDYIWSDDMIHVPRYRQLHGAKEIFATEAGVPYQKEQNLWQDSASFEMTVDSVGSLDSIYFKRTNVLEQALGEENILIRSEASGVNFRDVLLVLGQVPWTTPGFEGAGTVLEVGSKVTDLKPGDKVFYGAMEGGSFSTHIQVPARQAGKLPAGMTIAESASLSVSYPTAYMCLVRIGRLQKGEKVLIHAASGAVGQACIVLAQYIGAQVFVTAGSPAKRKFLEQTFRIPEGNIFSSRTPEFRDGILAATDGQGVDVVVNSLSGNLLQQTWAIIGEFGRFLEIGKRDLLQNSYLTMRPFDRNVSFYGIDLRTLFLKKPEEHLKCQAGLNDLMKSGVAKPIQPISSFPVSDISRGFRKLQSGQNIGKVVITMDQDERVLAESARTIIPKGNTLLKPNVTYVITGGTGGIGLSLGPWFVDHGARNVVLLGRSGSSRPQVQQVLERYKGTDVTMRAISCDVGLKEDVAKALDAIQDMPPVGGALHGALFLNDKILENSTFEDWNDISRPRHQGAWNLHDLLPKNLDFFVLLASMLGGGGNIGQSIYSGTASFYDSFADYRNSLGLPTVSIALPVILGVGYVADRGLEDKLSDSLGATLTQEHLRTVIKGAIVGASSGVSDGSKAISFSFDHDDYSFTLPWQAIHPRAIATYVAMKNSEDESPLTKKGASRGKRLQLDGASDPQTILLEALMDKVSSITMIERDEIEPDFPLSNYGLDSLVSVELRNWIRRETGVELALPKIVNANHLRAMAASVLLTKGDH